MDSELHRRVRRSVMNFYLVVMRPVMIMFMKCLNVVYRIYSNKHLGR